MNDKLKEILDAAMEQISSADNMEKLDAARVGFLGKKGELTQVLKGMRDVAPEDRPKIGQMVNEARAVIENSLAKKKEEFQAVLLQAKLSSEKIDVTLPGKKPAIGHLHPNTVALNEVKKFFIGMGYQVVDGPEIEHDYYNFEAQIGRAHV